MSFELSQQVRALLQLLVVAVTGGGVGGGRLTCTVLADGPRAGGRRGLALDGATLDVPVIRPILI